MKEITTTDIIKEIQRELNMRKKVFPTWVLQGRLKQDIAEKRIKIFEEILEDYKQKLISETKQACLF
ncbi:MAG: hypothetical protein IJK26_02885 [Clostridia bacterium]|nr:hypothetical protein [Clostridia bacterium]